MPIPNVVSSSTHVPAGVPPSQHGVTSLGVLSQLSAQTQTHLWSAGGGREREQRVFLLGRGQEKGWAYPRVTRIVHKTNCRPLKLRHFASRRHAKLQILL